jgi:hypothetical protein
MAVRPLPAPLATFDEAINAFRQPRWWVATRQACSVSATETHQPARFTRISNSPGMPWRPDFAGIR